MIWSYHQCNPLCTDWIRLFVLGNVFFGDVRGLLDPLPLLSNINLFPKMADLRQLLLLVRPIMYSPLALKVPQDCWKWRWHVPWSRHGIYIHIYIYVIYIYVIYNYIIIYAYTIILRVINPLIVSYSDLYTYYMNSHSAMTWLVPVDPKDPTWHAHIPRLATSGWPNGPVLWSRMAVDNHQLIDCKQYKCALYI